MAYSNLRDKLLIALPGLLTFHQQEPLVVKASPEWDALDLYASNIPLTGWCDNVTAGDEIKRQKLRAARLKVKYEGRPLGDFAERRDEASDPDLKFYIKELSKHVKIDEEAVLEPGANVADAQGQLDDGAIGTLDILDATAPTTGPGRAQRRRIVLTTPEAQKRLKNMLLEARPLIREGCRNVRRNHEKTALAISDDDLIEGIEDRVGPDGTSFRLEGHQREAVGRWEDLVRRRRAVLLADDMGLGKTAVAIAVIQRAVNAARGAVRKPLFIVAVPSSLLSNWLHEFKRAPTLRVLDMGAARDIKPAHVQRNYDVVLVSHQTLGSRYGSLLRMSRHWKAVKEGLDGKVIELLGDSAGKTWAGDRQRAFECIYALEADQLIVDEAHNARNPSTGFARSLRTIKAWSRVAITGTPMQNGLSDFGSILLFLNVRPFCIPALFKACFTSKRYSSSMKGVTKVLYRINDAMIAAIRSGLAIRRTKDSYYDDERILDLPDWNQKMIAVGLSDEPAEYQEMTQDMWDLDHAKHIAQMRAEDPVQAALLFPARSGPAQALLEILLCRMNVIHPDLFDAKYGDHGIEDIHRATPGTLAAYDVDLRDVNDAVDGPVESGSRPRIPRERNVPESSARDRAKLNGRRDLFLRQYRLHDAMWRSDRLYAVVTFLGKVIRDRRATAAGLPSKRARNKFLATHKILVFCEFLSALDLAEIGLRKEMPREATLRFDGSMTRQERDQVKRDFEEVGKGWDDEDVDDEDEGCPEPHEALVMFVTNKAGYEGHNFIHATEVLIIAPTWNPTVEDQIACRAARKGQRNTVTLYHFYSQDSIERRIRDIQCYKREQVNRVLDDAFLIRHSAKLEVDHDEVFLKRIGHDRAKKALSRKTFVV